MLTKNKDFSSKESTIYCVYLLVPTIQGFVPKPGITIREILFKY